MKNLFFWLLTLACFALMVWGFLAVNPQDVVTLTIRLKSENRFAAQVFWSGEADGKFDRLNSMSRTIENGTPRIYSFRIPYKKIRRLRFDFGKNPGRVVVYGMHLLGAKSENLDFGKFTFSKDVESHSLVGDGKFLEIKSSKVDPFIIYNHPLDVAAGFMPERTMVAWLAIIVIFSMLLSGALERLFRRCFCTRENILATTPRFHPSAISAETSAKIRNLGFVCAIFVVLMHTSPGYRPMPVGSLAWWLYSIVDVREIAVPFFFMVSGYMLVGHFGEVEWFRSAMSKRLKTLLVPFILWCLLWIAWMFCCTVISNAFNSLPLSTGLRPWMSGSDYLGLNPVQHPLLGPLWYVRALLVFAAVSPVLIWLLARGKWVVLACAFLAGMFCPRHAQSVGNLSYTFVYVLGFGCMFYFLVGMSLRLGQLKIPNGVMMNLLGWCGMGCFFVCNGIARMSIPASGIAVNVRGVLHPFVICFLWQVISCRQWPRWLTSMAFPIFIVHWFMLDLYGCFFPRCSETLGQLLFQFGWTIFLTMGIVAALRLLPKKVSELLFGGR